MMVGMEAPLTIVHRMRVVTLWVTITALWAAFPTAYAQGGNSMERILAVVGPEIILQSDVEGQLAMLKQRSPNAPIKEAEARAFILDQLINERLIMAAALEDTLIKVTDDEITQRMDMQIQMLVQQFGSEKRIEDLYGMSMSRIRRDFRDEIRKQLLVEKMRQKELGDVKVSRRDVEQFYDEFKDSIPVSPERVDLYHIVRYVQASEDQQREAYDLALRIRDSIMNGGSFADFARRYSADPGSATAGGDLGFVEKGKFVPTFEAAAFALNPKEISQPVESPFGWHIIQLIDKTASAINSRHILIKVGQSDADRERTREALQELRDSARSGASFEALARTFSDEKETKGFGGAMGEITLGELPPSMKEQIESLKDGDVSEPLPYAADPTKPGYHIMYRKKTIAAHRPTLESDYKSIERMATFAKKQRMEQTWVQELRQRLYWEKR